MVLVGQLKLDDEHKLVSETKDWLVARTTQCPTYAAYLDRWGDWANPWQAT
jgi:hypothetical protein